MKTKKALRKEILQLRDALTLEEHQYKSHQITAQVVAQKEFMEAEHILLFASYKSEVDTTELFQTTINAGKSVYYPKVIGSEMEFYKVEKAEELIEGYRGIREPKADERKKFVLDADINKHKLQSDSVKSYISQSKEKICVIMPGAVFDKDGNRIGYGGGFYDKFLQRLENACITKIAVAFDCQIVENGKIERKVHDIKPNYIVTEHHIISIFEPT